MSLSSSFHFDISSVPESLLWMFSGIGVSKLLSYFYKKFKLSIKPQDIKDNFLWIRLIFIHALSFIILAELACGFEKIHLKPISNLVWRLNVFNITSGARLFINRYPEASMTAWNKWKNFKIKKKLEKITGIKFEQEDNGHNHK